MEIVTMIGQLILSLMIMVGLHELGHMLPAKYFGMRVEKFFIGFPPRIFSFRFKDTEYGIGSIPLGGFVKISGMVDESMDKSQLAGPPKPWEFRSKPAWQRLIVMIGGVTVNAILGIVIFTILTTLFGEVRLTKSEARYGIVAYDAAQKIGLKTGDKVLKVNGKDYSFFSELYSSDVLLSSGSYYTVERNGKVMDVPIPTDLMEKLSDSKNEGQFIDAAFPFAIDSLSEDAPGRKAGLKQGDRILKMNDTPIFYFHELQEYLKGKSNTPVNMTVLRNNDTLQLPLVTNAEGKIGLYPKSLLLYDTIHYDFFHAIVPGTQKAFSVVFDNFKGLKKMAKGEMSPGKSVRGPAGIAKLFGGNWNWLRFWALTGMISMVLAMMNLLPIPALDGGHVVFLLYEIILRRKPSERFMEIAQYCGMAILLSLMVFATFNDFMNN